MRIEPAHIDFSVRSDKPADCFLLGATGILGGQRNGRERDGRSASKLQHILGHGGMVWLNDGVCCRRRHPHYRRRCHCCMPRCVRFVHEDISGWLTCVPISSARCEKAKLLPENVKLTTIPEAHFDFAYAQKGC